MGEPLLSLLIPTDEVDFCFSFKEAKNCSVVKISGSYWNISLNFSRLLPLPPVGHVKGGDG